ncbi:uncharacterized protein LOC106693752 [Microplitis demolitor]|uniref:uncharacterized protein LOC106693752 n=1 Tax=Microplitis demolitor TaxID=69319 RepID=UPI00235B6E56|nr:uncharacterized protein LOC106693752 [Microplitis demolitor]
MATKEVTNLKRRRGDIKSRITRLNTFITNSNESTSNEQIQTRVEALTDSFNSIYTIHEDLLEHDKDNAEDHNKEVIEIEEYYYNTIASARKITHDRTAKVDKNVRDQQQASSIQYNNNPSQNNDPVAIMKPHIRLPEISIPKFDGSIEKWQSFRDMFISRIGNNESLAGVDKITYLQNSLTGKAARAIEAIEPTETNYKIAWDILQRKYDNTRKAMLKHWSILNNYPRLQRDTPEALNDLIDIFRQHLRALKSLNEQVEECNGCILYILLTKINNHTKIQWESTLSDNKMPKYTSLIEFLEKRGNCSEYTSESKENPQKYNRDFKPNGKPQNQPNSKSFVTTNKVNNLYNNNQQNPLISTSNPTSTTAIQNTYPCPICKDAHTVYKCKTFISSPIEQRIQLTKKAGLC